MTILRDFVARGRSLPGVPSNLDTHAWPNSLNLRSVPSSSVNNGGDYVACRKVLLTRYASRWLLALHDQDITLYSKLLYEIMADLASESDRPDALSNFLDPGISEHHRKVRSIGILSNLAITDNSSSRCERLHGQIDYYVLS